MVAHPMPRRILRGFGRLTAIVAVLASAHGQTSWEADFPAVKDGRAARSQAVPLEDGSSLVAIALPGADAARSSVNTAGKPCPVTMIGHDPVTRLCFFKTEAPLPKRPWADSAPAEPGTPLLAPGPLRARASGWVKQIGVKVLPFALLQVSFDGPVPPTGTPLTMENGRVVALVFQEGSAANTAYAIPVEAVQRVRPDILKAGKLVRGWLGISLRAESPTPQVTRVTPGSPAEKMGVIPGDVLVQIGPRRVKDYADAANAFFYLIPGTPVSLRLLRGADQMEIIVNPVATPGGR